MKREPDLLVDTSVAVAMVVTGHDGHLPTLGALENQILGLSGHAWFETFSVLTRLPPPARRPPSTVHEILQHNFPASRFLSAESARELADELRERRIAGGSVYDALVGAVAREHEIPLVSRDVRAMPTYRSLGVDLRLIA